MAPRPAATTTRIVSWQAALITPVMPIALMALSTLGVLGIAWLLVWWIDSRIFMYGVVTAIIMTSGTSLSVASAKLFGKLTSRQAGINWLLWQHVALTVALAHFSMLMFVWFGSREGTWTTWALGSAFIIASWLLRRLSRVSTSLYSDDDGKTIGLPGSSFFD